ncbi:MAG: MFS transporter [Propionibacteriaceae bacterium]|nr:MFS transporter [Propionibacteriaceae bacterium]
MPETTYSLLVRNASLSWLASAFVARLPYSMLTLTLVLFGQELTGSFALAGLLVAAFSLGGALGAPVVGLLADRFGRRRALLVLTAAGAVSMAALAALAWVPVPLAVQVLVSGLVGATNGQVGAMARAGWSAAFAGQPDGRRKIEVAMSYETVADEVSFVAGPILGATLAAAVTPVFAVGVAWALLVIAQTTFAFKLPAARTLAGGITRGRVPARMAAWLLLSFVVGAVFGTTQTGLAALFQDTPNEVWTGLVYGAMGVGSAVSGLFAHRVLGRWSLPVRVVGAGVGMALFGLGLALTQQPLILGLACFTLGLCVAPLLIAASTGTERLAEPGNTLVLTLLATALMVGVGSGASVAGWVIEAFGAPAALAMPTALGVVAALSGVLARLTRADAHGVRQAVTTAA